MVEHQINFVLTVTPIVQTNLSVLRQDMQVRCCKILIELAQLHWIGKRRDTALESGVPYSRVHKIKLPSTFLPGRLSPRIVPEHEDKERSFEVRNVSIERREGESIERAT